jgi:hypothetical protein
MAVAVADAGAPQCPLNDPRTEAGFRAAFCTFSPSETLRKTGPLVMFAWRSHCSRARIGQVHSDTGVLSGWLHRAISTSLPCLSWSVFDLGSVMVIPLPLECYTRCSKPDAGHLRPAQAADEPNQDQGPVPGRGQGRDTSING